MVLIALTISTISDERITFKKYIYCLRHYDIIAQLWLWLEECRVKARHFWFKL